MRRRWVEPRSLALVPAALVPAVLAGSVLLESPPRAEGVGPPCEDAARPFSAALAAEQQPKRLEEMEKEKEELHWQLADPTLYQKDSSAIPKTQKRLEELEQELIKAYGRWETLEAVKAGEA